MKARANISIDADVLQMALDKYKGRLSSMVNEYLKDILQWESPRLEEKEEEEKNQEELKKQLALSQSRLKEIGIHQKVADNTKKEEERKALVEKALRLREIEDESR